MRYVFVFALGGLLGFATASVSTTTLMQRPDRPWIPRPLPPKPPAPEPLAQDDARLFERLRGQIGALAAERAASEVDRQFTIAANDLAKDPDVMLDDPETQGVAGVLIAQAIVAFVKKVVSVMVANVLPALIGAAVVALLVKYWAFIVPAWVGTVWFTAVPAGWAAAKFAVKPKE